MKQRPRNSGRDRDQVMLPVEYLDLRCTRHFRQIDGAAAADEGGAFFSSGDAGQVRRQLSGMDEERLGSSLLHRGCQRIKGMRIFNCELSDPSATEAGQMRSAAQLLAHLVGDGPYIGPRGHTRAKASLIADRKSTRLNSS